MLVANDGAVAVDAVRASTRTTGARKEEVRRAVRSDAGAFEPDAVARAAVAAATPATLTTVSSVAPVNGTHTVIISVSSATGNTTPLS